MHRKFVVIAIALVSIMFIVVFFNGNFLSDNPVNDTDTLEPVEIREYNGERLSAIDDFRENSIKGPQYIDKENYTLHVTGLVEKEIEFTYDNIVNQHQLFEKVVTLHCVEGWSVTLLWEGILVRDVIAKAGIDPRTEVVIFYAYDNYSTSLPLDYILENDIIMAYKMNGVVLPPERGFPFQLVAESKLGYKWIKWITHIELSNEVNHKGFWESRGYSNDANV